MTPTPEMLSQFDPATQVVVLHDPELGDVTDIGLTVGDLAQALALIPGEPVGWQLVPKELTTEMREALMMIRQELGSTLMDNADEIYSAFLSWAPKPPAAPAPLPVAVKALRWKGPDSYGEYHSLDGLWGYIIRAEDDGHWLTEVGDYFPSPEAAQAAAQADYETRIRSALSSPVGGTAQCCMCGKKGLSTAEGDGGSECELSDGRWVCSIDCWDKAVEPGITLPTPHSDIAALREETSHKTELLGYANAYRMQGGSVELGGVDIDNLEDVHPWAIEFEEHIGIAEIRLLPDTAGKSGAEVRFPLQHVRAGMSQAIDEVLAERRRQIEAEGWTPWHDDAHSDGELARAASSYAYHASWTDSDRMKMANRFPQNWPWERSWWKPTSRRRDLIKAAALIVAEIERLDRSALSQQEEAGR